MSEGPAGRCEGCGGPQVWTVVRGEMYVHCELECFWSRLNVDLGQLELPLGPDGTVLAMRIREDGDGATGRRLYQD